MLATIENAYLFLLRVLILAVASLALIVVVLAAVGALPLVAHGLAGNVAHDQVAGASLRDWIAEKRAEGVTAPPDTSEPSETRTPPGIARAVDYLAQYDRQKLGANLDRASARSMLMEIRNTIPDDYQATYETSLNAMLGQLVQSTGEPLDIDRINELLVWHGQKVKAYAGEQVQQEAVRRATALQSLAVAAGALVTFILLVFCFLFVKIERNLRLIHVAEAKSP